MAGTKRTIGYKPTADPAGWGGPAAPGVMRGSTFAGRNRGYWITRLGGRVGKGGSSDTTMRYAAFEADRNNHMPGGRLGSTGTFSVRQLMADRVSGGNYEHYVLGGPIPVSANQAITLAGLGTGQSWAHGQDNSGAIMHERGGLSSVPSSFGSTNSRPEGRMALWAIAYDDAPPSIPLWDEDSGGVFPGHGHSVTDDTPIIEFDFRSTNEQLPGYQVGEADRLTQYHVEIWNAAKTSRLHNSGRQNATAAMRNARRAQWIVPASLSPGRYVVRSQVFNAFGTPSAWREWVINIVGAGSIAIAGPSGITNDDTPDIHWSYSHRQNLAMDAIRVRVMDRNEANIIRPDVLFDFSPDPVNPSTGILEWEGTGWAVLPVGAHYTVLAQAIDTDGQPSPWSAGQQFRLNAPPYVPINREPVPGTVLTSIPELSAMARDADDPAATTPTEFEVRKIGGTESITKVGIYNRPDNRWRLNLIAENVVPPGDYGEWEWRVRSTDPHGAVGEWSTWLRFEYVPAPTVSVTSPVDTVAVANPSFAWTVDRSQTAYRIQLFDAEAGDPIRNGDTGWITSPENEHIYPSLLLRHDQAIRGRIDVITSGNIPGSIEWEFIVAYTPPATVTGVIAETVQMPYDFVNTATGVRVTWDEVDTEPIDFSAYLVQRRNTITGEVEPLAVIRDRAQTEWVDESTPSGTLFEFEVIQEVWESLDLIPSVPAGDTAMVEKIVGVVVTPVIGGGAGVTLAHWLSLDIDYIQDMTARNSWAAKPRVSAGPTNYRIVAGSAYMLGDTAEGRYTDTDLADALRSLTEPFVDVDGAVRPRTLCIRLSDGRIMYGTITKVREGDWGPWNGNSVNASIARRMLNIQFTETNFKRGGF